MLVYQRVWTTMGSFLSTYKIRKAFAKPEKNGELSTLQPELCISYVFFQLVNLAKIPMASCHPMGSCHTAKADVHLHHDGHEPQALLRLKFLLLLAMRLVNQYGDNMGHTWHIYI